MRARILALGPSDSPSPNWGDGSYGCAGCATTEGLCRPGFLRWAPAVEEPAGVVVQSGHGDTWFGAAALPSCKSSSLIAWRWHRACRPVAPPSSGQPVIRQLSPLT